MKLSSSSHGFTLVECLVTVVVVALLSLGATAKLRGMREAAGTARDQQNAQQLAAVAMSAQAAGVELVDPSGDLRRTVETLSEGRVAERGAFAGQYFGVRLGAGEVESAMRHLEVRGGMLVYRPR